MTKLEKLVVSWWKCKRPVAWTVDEHIRNPLVNIDYRGGATGKLAKAAAKIVKDRKQKPPAASGEERAG